MENERFSKQQFEQLTEEDFPIYFFLVNNANYCKLVNFNAMEYYYFEFEDLPYSKQRIPKLKRRYHESTWENIMWYTLVQEPIQISKDYYETIIRNFS